MKIFLICSSITFSKQDNIHKNWICDHELLEDHHGYVQWLFPIRSQPLSKFEAENFRKSKNIRQRVVKSYEMMLDFYGAVLLDRETGEIGRNPVTSLSRYKDLNRSFNHNYLRITRILKFLGVVGLEHYKFRFLNHIVLEIFKTKKMSGASDSCVRFWIPTLRKPENILKLDKLVMKYGRKVRRDGRDGWGDEKGESWFTQYYIDNFSEDEDDKIHICSFEVKNEVLTADSDPFEKQRGEMFKIYEKKRRERKKRFQEMRKKYGIKETSSEEEEEDDAAAWSDEKNNESDDQNEDKSDGKMKDEEEDIENQSNDGFSDEN